MVPTSDELVPVTGSASAGADRCVAAAFFMGAPDVWQNNGLDVNHVHLADRQPAIQSQDGVFKRFVLARFEYCWRRDLFGNEVFIFERHGTNSVKLTQLFLQIDLLRFDVFLNRPRHQEPDALTFAHSLANVAAADIDVATGDFVLDDLLKAFFACQWL